MDAIPKLKLNVLGAGQFALKLNSGEVGNLLLSNSRTSCFSGSGIAESSLNQSKNEHIGVAQLQNSGIAVSVVVVV